MAVELANELRNINILEAKRSYNDLFEYDAKTYPGLSRIGLKALDYFFLPYRLRTKTKRHISFFEAINDAECVNLLNIIVKRWKKDLPSDKTKLLKAQYDVFQLYYGTVNQFRPTVAKWIYCKMKAKQGILDFSAGWGGRCLAAMSLGIPYIGVDSNTHLKTSYQKMIQTYQPEGKVQMIFEPSETVDFSKFKYDLIFTSPPYFMLEEYEKMPKYKTKQEFLDDFFIPVVQKAWASLTKSGKMALNMPEEMYLAIRDILPPIQNKLVLKIANRHSSADKTYGEFIYIWHKRSNETRRNKQRGLSFRLKHKK